MNNYFMGMRACLIPAVGAIGLLAGFLAPGGAQANPGPLKAVIFDDVKPLYQRSGGTYEGLGVDITQSDQGPSRTVKRQFHLRRKRQGGHQCHSDRSG